MPRRGDNSPGELLSLAASLLVSVIGLAGLAVAVFVLWPALALAAAIYLGRRPLGSAARGGRRLVAAPAGWWRGRQNRQQPGSASTLPAPALIARKG